MTADLATTSVLSTAWTRLDAALRARRPVLVSYHGLKRLLCPHALGWRADRAMVLGYQTGGDTSSGKLDPDPTKRWRLLYVDEIDDVIDTSGTPWGTANNYNAQRPSPAIDQVSIAVNHKHSPPRS